MTRRVKYLFSVIRVLKNVPIGVIISGAHCVWCNGAQSQGPNMREAVRKRFLVFFFFFLKNPLFQDTIILLILLTENLVKISEHQSKR